MGVNKVTMNTPDGEQTVMDITGTTATPETVADGVVFYGADGERKTGTALGGIPVPETAQVGETVVVREVDTNGKPTKWRTSFVVECDHPSNLTPNQPVVPSFDEAGNYYGWQSRDFIPDPGYAEPGQTIVVTAVDENGKPIEWTAVNLPEGLPPLADTIPNQPIVPYHSMGDDLAMWTQKEFIPADVVWEAGQSVRWTGEWDEQGNMVWEAFTPTGGGGSYSDWSEADKDAMAEYVIAKLPVYNGEVEDV